MPVADFGEASIHYELSGKPEAPVLILANSLGTDLHLWEPQACEFSRSFRLLRYDMRGHGQSSTPPGPYTIHDLGRDVIHLLDELHISRAHFCGLSVGGMVGQWLGIYAAHRLIKLVLSNTAARMGSAEFWNERMETLRRAGMQGVASMVVERWFTPEFRRQFPEVVKGAQRMVERTNADGYLATCAAIRDVDQRADAHKITIPTLVISGSHDSVATPEDGRWLSNAISDARHLNLPAAHLSNLEARVEFKTGVLHFLKAGGIYG